MKLRGSGNDLGGTVRLLCLLPVVLLLATPAFAGFYIGEQLRTFCASGVATAYVTGAYDAYEVAYEFGQSKLRVCLPPSTTGMQITKVVCDYLDGDQNALASSAAVVVLAALRKAYPCVE